MLDDRVITSDPHMKRTASNNKMAWNAYLGPKRGTEDLLATAAPARLQNPAGLPPLYIEVGELDLFCDETIEYASKFLKAGVSTELHVFAGAPHGFEGLAPTSRVGSAAIASRVRAVHSVRAVNISPTSMM